MRATWIAAAILAIVVLVVALSGREQPALRSTTPTATANETAAPPAPRESPLPPTPAASPTPAEDSRYARRNERVSNAIALLRYPADSQPLTTQMHDVLEPNRRHETRMPLSFATGGSGNGNHAAQPGDLSYELTADVFTVVGKASLHPRLSVFRDDARVHVDVTSATVLSTSVTFDDDGNATITPSDIPELAGIRGPAHLDVDFVADGQRAHASLDFRVAGTTPATFVGVSGERLVPEGLELSVAIDVQEPGRYFIQGLLFDSNDSPIGYAVARPELTTGRATVPLVYFGLMFHDANANGPYVFRTLTGLRLPNGQEPDRADMDTWTGPYRTATYSLSDFSDQEYESAAKDAKISALANLARGH